ncbi:uncharacterized protein NESG_02477, partial [Nematocida ausubeli]
IQVGQKIPQEVQKKWSKIIQSIVEDDEDISYITVDDMRMIQPDIFNILIIMIKLIGIDYDEYKEEIQEYRDRLQNLELTDKSYNEYHFIREIEDCVYEIFSQIKRECQKDKILADGCSMPSIFSKNEIMIYYVDFEGYNIQIVNNANHLAGRITICYKTLTREQRICIHFVSSEKVHLGVGKSYYSDYPELLREINKMPKNSYSIHVLSEYVEAINPIDPYYAKRHIIPRMHGIFRMREYNPNNPNILQ